jgi:glycosyltransferase involved in cell wall biosynthesis
MPGRVLMIAHHFPPMGGSGANRALAFARYLPAYGWTPIVLTPGGAWSITPDHDLQSQIPTDLKVIRTRSLEPRPRPRLKGAAHPSPSRTLSPRGKGSLRSHLGHLKRFPDAHVGWLPFALAAARKPDYDALYSSSGPFTSHLVGLLLKRATGRPWLAELRDGWYRWNRAIFPDYPAWRDVLERRLEAAAIRNADRVVLVTERMAQAFRCQYRDLPADHFGVVSNGFDPAQFPGHDSPEPAGPGDFEVLHSGALYYGRSLAAFLDAAQRLCDADPTFNQAFRLTLVGTLDAAAAQETGRPALSSRIHRVGQVEHARAVAAMRSASLLLLVANTTPGAEATVPGKLFEYLALGRPILAICPPESSTADVLRQSGSPTAYAAPPDDPAAIASALYAAFEAHRHASAAPHASEVTLSRFDRRALAGELAHILDEISANADADAARRL